MDVSTLIPTPDSLSVPWPWFKVLLVLTFVLHLLLMNLMLGGSLLTLFGRRREGLPPPARGIPTLIALTINMGVAPLLFVQVLFGNFLYTSSVLMATFWILVIPVLIAAYYAAYGFVHQGEQGGGGARIWLGLSTLMLLFIGFMFSNNMTLMVRPERWGAYFAHTGGGFLNLSEPTLFPRYLHFVTASLAIAGLGRAVYYAVRDRRDGSAHPSEIRSGLRVFAFATMVQLLIGVLFWILLPGRIGSLFLGGNGLHTVNLWAGIVAGIAALLLALRGRVWATTALALLTVVLMVLVRDTVRSAYLGEHFRLADLPVVSQVSPLVLFLAAFLVVGVAVGWMVRQAWRAAKEARS